MRIYNATEKQLDLPFVGSQRITVAPHSVSGNIMGSSDFLSLLVTSYNTDEIALIVSGPYEINICAGIPTAVNYVVQTLDEALQKFGVKKEEPVVEEKKEEVKKEEPVKVEEEVAPAAEPEPAPVEEPKEEAKPEIVAAAAAPVKKPAAKKSTSKKKASK